MAQRYEVQMRLFDPVHKLPVLTEVPFRPKSGFQYIYKWSTSSKRKNWRSDGYRWRQNATVKFNHGEVKCKRYYFKLKVGPGNDYTMDFSKHAIECPLYEKQMLIWYQGDDSVVVDFSHGNSKDTDKSLNCSTLSGMDQTGGHDSESGQISTEFIVPNEPENNQNLDPSQSIEQNAPKPPPQPELLSLEALHNLVELRSETGFVNDIHLAPGVLVTCFYESTIAEFKEFLFREDLSSQCLTYDTTFEMGLFNLSALTYRQIEFEETPAVPLMLMIHEHNIASVHDFFFARLAEILPDLKSAENVIIITDEEDAVLQALKNHFPDLQRFRCWHRALQDIKEFLKGISITERQVVEEYKSDFVTLLNQETHTEYKSILAQMYLKKWEKEFSNFFDEQIDPDMHRMGAWGLLPLGIPVPSHSELFVSIMNRFSGWKTFSVDNMVISLMRVTEYFNDRITRGRIRVGDYTVKENMSVTYCQGDAIVPEAVTVDQLMNSIETEIKARKKGRRRWMKPGGIKRPTGLLEPDTNEEAEKRREISEAVDSLSTVVKELLEEEI